MSLMPFNKYFATVSTLWVQIPHAINEYFNSLSFLNNTWLPQQFQDFNFLKDDFSEQWLLFAVVIQLLSCVQPFTTPWVIALWALLYYPISWSLHKFTSIESLMPSSHLILCHPLLLSSVFPSIRALPIRWPKYWSFSISNSPSNAYSGLISFRIYWFDLLRQLKGLSRVFSSTTFQKHQFFSTQPSFWTNSYIHTWLLEKPLALTIWAFVYDFSDF